MNTRLVRNSLLRRFSLIALPIAFGLGACSLEPAAEHEETASSSARFISLDANPANDTRTSDHLIRRAFDGVQVCLQGTNVTNETRPGFENWIRLAIQTWLAGASGASTRELNNDVTFACDNPDVTVNWSRDVDRAHGDWEWLRGNDGEWEFVITGVSLFQGDTFTTVLHEFGHVFGIGDTYIENVWTCQPGQENSVMCGEGRIPEQLQPDDIGAIQEIYCAAFPNDCQWRWSFAPRLCGQNGGQLYLGDFNGDGRDDLLCHDKADGHWFTALADVNGTFSETSGWSSKVWCREPLAQLHLGDFNGDGRDDLLCHDRADGTWWTTTAAADGSFNDWKYWRGGDWCSGESERLYVGDFNGDNREDMLCHNKQDGSWWTAAADASGIFQNRIYSAGNDWWCTENKANVLVGDFDGNGFDDMLCYDLADGRWRTAMNDTNGNFVGGDWSPAAICDVQDDIEIRVGDFNGDGRGDLLCHDKDALDQFETIAFASASGSFPGISRKWKSYWCSQNGESLLVADFDADTADDLLCVDSDKSAKSILFPAL